MLLQGVLGKSCSAVYYFLLISNVFENLFDSVYIIRVLCSEYEFVRLFDFDFPY